MRALPSQQATQPGPYWASTPARCVWSGSTPGSRGHRPRPGRVASRASRQFDSAQDPAHRQADLRRRRTPPGTIEGGGTVDDIVRAPEHNYVAAIGGDIHNYQRYPVRPGRRAHPALPGERWRWGLHARDAHHRQPRHTRARRSAEAEFRCYPLRGDSLSRFSQLWSRKWLGRLRGARPIEPDVASAILGERLKLTPTRTSAQQVPVSDADRKAADAMFRLPARKRGALHLPFSEFLDWNQPPMFKSFLRVDADEREVRVRCFGATGCGEQETTHRSKTRCGQAWTARGDGPGHSPEESPTAVRGYLGLYRGQDALRLGRANAVELRRFAKLVGAVLREARGPSAPRSSIGGPCRRRSDQGHRALAC